MDITLNRLIARGALWSADNVSDQDLDSLVTKMAELPFQGDDEDRKYGFAHCGAKNEAVYGLFVQKFPKQITDYNAETKEETSQSIRDTGEYLFIFYPKRYELYLQAKRSSDLPSNIEIIKRFVGVMRSAVGSKGKFLATTFDYTEDEVDRNRIIEIFYQEADIVSELELQDFDRSLILEQKAARDGQYQTYFNPIDEYQPAMEEAALRFGNNTDKVTIKAKQGESFKKDPIVRAMLEGSRRPIRIVYKKDSEYHTEYGLTKKKEVITIEASGLDVESQIDGILAKIEGSDTLRSHRSARHNDQQTDLFN